MILVLFLIAFGYWLLCGWALMMLVGVLHHQWWPVIPTMGYGTALLVSLLLHIVLAVVGRGGGSR